MLGGKSDQPPPQGLELSLAIHHLRMMAQKWEAVGMANSKGWASLRPSDAKGRKGCILLRFPSSQVTEHGQILAQWKGRV